MGLRGYNLWWAEVLKAKLILRERNTKESRTGSTAVIRTGNWPSGLEFIQRQPTRKLVVGKFQNFRHHYPFQIGRFAQGADMLQKQAVFGYMNGLYERLGLPEEMNKRVSEGVGQLIEELS